MIIRRICFIISSVTSLKTIVTFFSFRLIKDEFGCNAPNVDHILDQ